MMYDGISQSDLAARLRAPAFLVLPTVTSTLDVVHELAAEGAPGGLLVLADEQVKGRGRQGRVWHSPAGRGVWLGYLMRGERRAAPGVLSLRAGLAVADALEFLGVDVSLKWPNDVLLAERKLAGVLCEARWQGDSLQWVAVGIGINVHGPLPTDVADRACALGEFASGVTRAMVLEQLVPRLHAMPEAPLLTQSERTAFARRDWLAGREVSAPVAGRAAGISAEGGLLVETPRGREAVASGSVTLASPLSSAPWS